MSLKDAIGKDAYHIDDDLYRDDDLLGMSTEELEALKMRIDRKIDGLSIQIKEKQIDYCAGGAGADKDWFVRHKSAQSINRQMQSYVSALLKRRHRAERRIGDFFMDKARAFLSERDFEAILAGARMEMRLAWRGND